MTALRIIAGDATCPQAKGQKIVAHVCNDRGGWGKGFVLALSRRWSGPEAGYRRWHRERAGNDFALGAVQVIRVQADIQVANMVGQHGIAGPRHGSGRPPVRYEAIDQCLHSLAEHALAAEASVHMPRIGCGLAGGSWTRIEPLITQALCARGIAVTVYDPA